MTADVTAAVTAAVTDRSKRKVFPPPSPSAADHDDKADPKDYHLRPLNWDIDFACFAIVCMHTGPLDRLRNAGCGPHMLCSIDRIGYILLLRLSSAALICQFLPTTPWPSRDAILLPSERCCLCSLSLALHSMSQSLPCRYILVVLCNSLFFFIRNTYSRDRTLVARPNPPSLIRSVTFGSTVPLRPVCQLR